MDSYQKCSHPGTYARENIIPSGMSVKDAAKLLGIGRPALSKFLNGKAALSPNMAVRLEKAFGADRKRLLDMQATYDQQEQRASEKEVAVRAFVPKFLTISARQIQGWANQLDARAHLPVLLRVLVHSTCSELNRVDFPGYDNAQRKGPDGIVEAGDATPWIPKGKSYWELSVEKQPKTKADKDYTVRLTSMEAAERAKSTFVFVTPRDWPGKTDWETEKNNKDDWKAVRVFDASDLEQWLEQSIAAQIWLAEKLALPRNGYETLEYAWSRWTNVSEPRMTPAIFAPSITAYRDTFKKWIGKPNEKPFVVAADSRDEALAFLACLFNDEELRRHKDIAAIFTSPETLRTLLASSISFIPIVHSVDVERELGDAHRRLPCIVFRPRNAVNTKADITLDLLNPNDFAKALTTMGFDESNADRLAKESGRSPTILRRRLSQNNAIKIPVWAGDNNTAKALIPMALIGVWHAEPKADREIAFYVPDRDREIISYVAGREYEAVEDDVARLLQFDDSPVWCAGQYRGVASKIDALFAIARMITQAYLDRFFDAAENVLSESDPALDLPEDNKWAATLYGKKSDHSNALREGICETLVILSVHGNNLFKQRLGVDVQYRVERLIDKFLTPLSLEKLLAHDHDLKYYAEAAPRVFLRIIKDDLRSSNPVVLGLLKPVDRGAWWVAPPRTGLLWALECLAWKSENLPYVTPILAQLSQQKIDDNWGNKPISSLRAIFSAQIPQTAAPVERRIKALEMLTKRFPDIGWDICCICISQINPDFMVVGHPYNSRPRWRSDASGAGQVVTREECHEFAQMALSILIDWPNHNEKTFGDLVCLLQGMPEDNQVKVWNLIDKWSQKADDAAKATLRERIRQSVLTKRGRQPGNEMTRNRARQAFDSLKPHDPVIRHGWLFAQPWIQESVDESTDEDFDYQKRDERIDKQRREAMAEVWNEQDFEGVKALLAGNSDAYTVGRYAASCLTEAEPLIDFVRHCLSLDEEPKNKIEMCLQGFFSVLDEESCISMSRSAVEILTAEERKPLLICAPFRASTWRLLDDYSEDIRVGYWKDVCPSWGRYSPAELSEMIDCLLEAQRPRAAFSAVRTNFKDIETSRFKRLLHDIATVNTEPVGHFMLDRSSISDALNSLNGRAGVTRDEMAQLEFLFMEALINSEHGIPNLESKVAESPTLFVQAVVLFYPWSGEREDPPAWKIENSEQQAALMSAAYSLLDRMKKIPGEDENGKIDVAALSTWLAEVRRLCCEYKCADAGDYCLGQLLAKAPKGENDIWPCDAVCEAMEKIASPGITRGFDIGAYNSRGTHWRGQGEGGEQERQLATRYRNWAECLCFDYPYVGGILEGLAKSYERDAVREDSEANIRKRLRH